MFKMLFFALHVLVFISFCTIPCFGQTGDETIALVNSLFENYSISVRPNRDHMKPMNIDVNLILVGINGLNEVEGKFTTTGYLSISWTDEYLNWTNPFSVFQIYVSQSQIWKPDLTLKNGFEKLSELGTDFIQVKVLQTGLVEWQPFEVFNSKCDIDITHFPFDVQTCDLIFVVWSTFILDVNVTLGPDGLVLEDIDESQGQWTILSKSSSYDQEGTESKVTFSLKLERKSSYYVFNIIIPVVFLGLLNVFTFVIPADSGEKMGYSMTVFLSFAVFLTIVSSELPKTSGSYFGYYLMMLLGLGVITVCSTAIELRLHFRTGPVPPWLEKCMKRGCCCCCRKNQVQDLEDSGKKKRSKTSWPDVTAAFDFLMFTVLLALFLLATVAVMIMLVLRF